MSFLQGLGQQSRHRTYSSEDPTMTETMTQMAEATTNTLDVPAPC